MLIFIPSSSRVRKDVTFDSKALTYINFSTGFKVFWIHRRWLFRFWNICCSISLINVNPNEDGSHQQWHNYLAQIIHLSVDQKNRKLIQAIRIHTPFWKKSSNLYRTYNNTESKKYGMTSFNLCNLLIVLYTTYRLKTNFNTSNHKNDNMSFVAWLIGLVVWMIHIYETHFEPCGFIHIASMAWISLVR